MKSHCRGYFAERLSEYLEANGLTAFTFAKKVDVSYQTVLGYLGGYRFPPVEQLFRISAMIGMDLNHLRDLRLKQ